MVFDAHSDIWSDVTVKSLQGETDIFRKYHYDRLKKGGTEGSVFVMWIDPPYDKQPDVRLGQIMEAVEKETAYCQDILRIVHTYEEMQKAAKEGLFYVFIGCEGLSGIGEELEWIDRLYEFGVRHASLTWNEQNALASGVCGDADSGLTKMGIKALHKIQEKHMLFDVSHLNDKSFWDVIHHAQGPVVATHSSSRKLCPAPRNLTDEMIRAVAATGGMIGVNAYPEFVAEKKEERTVEMLVRHIEHIADIAGIEHIGFGFDFCEFLEEETAASFSTKARDSGQDSTGAAGEEKEGIRGLKDSSEIPNLIQALQKTGFREEDIRKISRENWHNMIQKVM